MRLFDLKGFYNMKIEINLDDKYEKEPYMAALKAISNIIVKFGLSANHVVSICEKIITDVKEYSNDQQITNEFTKGRYDF